MPKLRRDRKNQLLVGKVSAYNSLFVLFFFWSCAVTATICNIHYGIVWLENNRKGRFLKTYARQVVVGND